MFTPCCEPPEVHTVECCTFSKEMVRLRDCFRLLWSQHVYWTRMVILGIAFDSPDLAQTTDRLLRNVTDFAKTLRCFYCKDTVAEYSRLVKDHLVIAGELVKASKAGDTAAAADLEKRWYENADQIACFLGHINPYWSVRHMRAMWHKHLALTKDEAVATLSGKFKTSIGIFDQIEYQAMMMADDFSDGIICQFHIECC